MLNQYEFKNKFFSYKNVIFVIDIMISSFMVNIMFDYIPKKIEITKKFETIIIDIINTIPSEIIESFLLFYKKLNTEFLLFCFILSVIFFTFFVYLFILYINDLINKVLIKTKSTEYYRSILFDYIYNDLIPRLLLCNNILKTFNSCDSDSYKNLTQLQLEYNLKEIHEKNILYNLFPKVCNKKYKKFIESNNIKSTLYYINNMYKDLINNTICTFEDNHINVSDNIKTYGSFANSYSSNDYD